MESQKNQCPEDTGNISLVNRHFPMANAELQSDRIPAGLWAWLAFCLTDADLQPGLGMHRTKVAANQPER